MTEQEFIDQIACTIATTDAEVEATLLQRRFTVGRLIDEMMKAKIYKHVKNAGAAVGHALEKKLGRTYGEKWVVTCWNMNKRIPEADQKMLIERGANASYIAFMIGSKSIPEGKDILKAIKAGTNTEFRKPPKFGRAPTRVGMDLPSRADEDQLTNIVAHAINKLCLKYGADRVKKVLPDALCHVGLR